MKYPGMTFAIVLAMFVGCMHPKSPYDRQDNWFVCDAPVCSYAASADIFYVQGDLYTNVAKLPPMNHYVQSEVGKGRFTGLARVFAPIISSEEDLKQSIQWYLGRYHTKKRPFVFVGEGKGGEFLKEYETHHAYILKKKGLVASFYTDEARKGFVNDDMIREIKKAISRARYSSEWHREMPAGMQN